MLVPILKHGHQYILLPEAGRKLVNGDLCKAADALLGRLKYVLPSEVIVSARS